MKKKVLILLIAFSLIFITGLFASTVTTEATTTKAKEVVAIFKGEGILQTAPFVVEKRWKIEWESPEDGNPMFLIWDMSTKNHGTFGGSKSGVSYYYMTGEFYIQVITSGQWTINIAYQ
jgi:hypothetical protein